jgi:hypothetical protein
MKEAHQMEGLGSYSSPCSANARPRPMRAVIIAREKTDTEHAVFHTGLPENWQAGRSSLAATTPAACPLVGLIWTPRNHSDYAYMSVGRRRRSRLRMPA